MGRDMSEQAPSFRTTAFYVALLGSMTALGAISTDIYLPSVPQVMLDLHTTALATQWTMTAMLIGNAVGQLVVGPLSDRFGRRRPALTGIACHVGISLLCAVAPNVTLLIGARALQGFGNAASAVVAMAVIRDRFVGRAASRLMSRLLLVIGVAPLFAPSVGGFIARFVTWRGVFVALACFGALLFVAVMVWLPESLPPERRSRRLGETLRGYGVLARDRDFLALAVIPGLNSAVLMSYVIGSSFVFQSGFGFTDFQFSMLFAINGCGLVGGAQIAAALTKRHTPANILRVSIPTMTLLAGWLFLVSVTGLGGLPLFIGSLFVLLTTINFSPPNASALAMARHGRRAGTAAAFIGGVQFGLSGLISSLVGVLGENAPAMSGVMFGAGLFAVVTLAFGTPIYRRGGPQKLDTAGLR